MKKINNKKVIVICIFALLILAAIFIIKKRNGSEPDTIEKSIQPSRGQIKSIISTTGTVLPQNRLELKPPVNVRVEKIMVLEGQGVRTGQILAWMSSTDRAALIDAARTQDSKSLKYWEEVYKPIPLVSPINGTVIVRSVEPGQTVQTTSPILVLSDRLIVKADVDETDIGRVREGQEVVISLDAYPDVREKGRVDHIYYESQLVNNVTIYKVDILPVKVPRVFRSGMSANIDIVEKMKKDALLVPSEAIILENQKNYLLVKKRNGGAAEKREVQTGLVDEQNAEILSGIKDDDTVIVVTKKSLQLDAKKTGNPFLPARKR
ncbi:MAG: efflux RND transporter periplasmic adaptor subunit [Spirochaetes bacterium]|nr:efflux RND transporter periplasmic adaptor subunit [Spirochaetota bacterium]